MQIEATWLSDGVLELILFAPGLLLDHSWQDMFAYLCACRPCAICQVEYEQGDTLATLPCKHCFHSGCVGQWLSAYSKKCPVCKAEVC